jgi:Flp pilus assembly CpaF family ATPase
MTPVGLVSAKGSPGVTTLAITLAALADGIHAALFGVGRLQPLLDDPQVENIDINDCDQVFVGYADGREEMAGPVADSDDELVDLIQLLGAYSGLTSRSFDAANRNWTCGCRTGHGCRP